MSTWRSREEVERQAQAQQKEAAQQQQEEEERQSKLQQQEQDEKLQQQADMPHYRQGVLVYQQRGKALENARLSDDAMARNMNQVEGRS